MYPSILRGVIPTYVSRESPSLCSVIAAEFTCMNMVSKRSGQEHLIEFLFLLMVFLSKDYLCLVPKTGGDRRIFPTCGCAPIERATLVPCVMVVYAPVA